MREWLVRSGGEIKGPYNFAELNQAILQQDVSLLDEVCQAFSRWTYVREHPDLKGTVHQVRDRIDQNLDRTHVETSGGQGETVTLTETLDGVGEITSAPGSGKSAEPTKPILDVKKYVPINDAQTQIEAREASLLWLKILGGIFAIVIIGFLSYRGFEAKRQSELTESRYLNMIRYAKLGLGHKAFEAYAQIKDKKILTKDDLWLMLPWILRYELNTELVQKVIKEKVESGSNDTDTMYQSFLANANLALFSGDVEKAKKFIQHAQATDPRAETPKLNLAVLALRAKDTSFSLLPEKVSLENMAMVTDLETMTAAILFMNEGRDLQSHDGRELIGMIEHKLTRPTYLQDRFLLLKAVWEDRVDQKTWETAFSGETEYKSDPYLFPDLLDPHIFEGSCSKANDKGVATFCALMMNQIPQAQRNLEEWEMQEQGSVRALLARGHFLEKTRSWKELLTLIDNPQIKDMEISAYWKFQICAQGLGNCDPEIAKWLGIEAKNVETEVALADLLEKMNRKAEAKKLYDRVASQIPERIDIQERLLESP